ncbi:RepB family plasmid replication initiator protein, partial [Staphylococcus epidermidis]|nr:RepB family plasmid replication initiator protein [Staphylococcus epidermidis]
MSGETVVYRNEMNLVPLRRFTSTEVDLFFTLCNKLKEQDTRKVIIPFEELKYLSNYYTRSQERFINDLEHVYDKMLNLTYVERNGRSFEKFELKEMTHLKSTYAKNMFRLLKQYKHTGYIKINISDFKNRLDIPKTYQMNDIT